MLNHHGMVHGVDYYGSILKQREYVYEAVDELDLLEESDYFRKHLGKLFKLDEEVENHLFNNRSLSNKPAIQIDECETLLDNVESIEVADMDEETVNSDNSMAQPS